MVDLGFSKVCKTKLQWSPLPNSSPTCISVALEGSGWWTFTELLHAIPEAIPYCEEPQHSEYLQKEVFDKLDEAEYDRIVSVLKERKA